MLQTIDATKKTKGAKFRREQSYIIRDLVTCLALCHNVTPTFPDPDDPTLREFQASSPDEIALVRFADHTLGMKLLERDQGRVVIQNTTGVKEEYHILANFPFSSDTKRMGIVLKNNENGQLIFYLKGAEVVMKDKVKPGQRVIIDEACENLAK
jgi:phospholipid-translocating ATPase